MRAVHWIGAVLLSLPTVAALACGHCVEDKVAAVYDHAAVTQARARQHDVAFFAIDGEMFAGEPVRRAVEQAARSVPGVTADSVRVSLDLAALALTFDPKRTSCEAVRKAVERKLSGKKLRLEEMKVLVH